MQRRGFLAATLATPGLALAQEWPSGPIRGIVPFAPGSATDTVARLFAERMRDTLGQPVVIENRAGASGLIGAEAVARAPADGMTLLFGTNSTNAAANALFRRVPFDMERDFAPISMLASVPLLVAVPEASPHRTLNDLLAAARARPEAVTYASTSASQRVASEMLASMAGVRLLHVPYRAAGAAIQDLLAGRVDMFVADQAVILPASQSGRARVLAVTTRSRSASSIRRSFSRSLSSILVTGTPVHLDTTAAMSSSVTSSFRKLMPCWTSASLARALWTSCSAAGTSPCCSLAAAS
jgi:tripartite-type tricarboxylate transporter receptor subunit TctC